MKGKVFSYVESKKFGFVKGDDEQTYFFHISDLAKQEEMSKLLTGSPVEFDPVPTRKGLVAKKVKILPTFLKKQLMPFFITKQAHPKQGFVEKKMFMSTGFYRDIDDAKQYLLKLAQETGCNAILNNCSK